MPGTEVGRRAGVLQQAVDQYEHCDMEDQEKAVERYATLNC